MKTLRERPSGARRPDRSAAARAGEHRREPPALASPAAELARAERYGHSLERLAPAAAQPAATGDPIQRMKRNRRGKKSDDDPKRQRTIRDFFGGATPPATTSTSSGGTPPLLPPPPTTTSTPSPGPLPTAIPLWPPPPSSMPVVSPPSSSLTGPPPTALGPPTTTASPFSFHPPSTFPPSTFPPSASPYPPPFVSSPPSLSIPSPATLSSPFTTPLSASPPPPLVPPPQTTSSTAPPPISSLFLSRADQIAALRRDHPQLSSVPDSALHLGAYNRGGPPVRVVPAPHPGPSPQTLVSSSGASDHVIDLSTGTFQIRDRSYDVGRFGPEGRTRTESDVRNYVSLTNAYLQHAGPRTITPTERGGEGSIGSQATAISSAERERNPSVYRERGGQRIYVGHVPDPMISGVPHSPMGLMPITSDANTIVGGASGLGARQAPLGRLLVRETGGGLHHYGPPPPASTSPSPAPPPITTSQTATTAPLLPPTSTTSTSTTTPPSPLPIAPTPAPSASSSGGTQLTPEQLGRIERNRLQAMELRLQAEARRRQQEHQ